MSMTMDEVTYRCTECGAEDKLAVQPDETPWVAMNCWKCGAGRGYPNHAEMVAHKIGMFPVKREPRPGEAIIRTENPFTGEKENVST